MTVVFQFTNNMHINLHKDITAGERKMRDQVEHEETGTNI